MPGLVSKTMGDIYKISIDAWTTLNKRAGGVCSQNAAFASLQDSYANDRSWHDADSHKGPRTKIFAITMFPELAIACGDWKTTFNDFVVLTENINAFAITFTNSLVDFQQKVNSLPTDVQQLPDDQKQQCSQLITSLDTNVKPFEDSCLVLINKLQAFLDVNVRANAQYDEQVFDGHGSGFVQTFQQLVDSIGLIIGEWHAISDDLKNLEVENLSFDMPFIESLGIDEAIAAWKDMQNNISIVLANKETLSTCLTTDYYGQRF